MPMDEQDGSIVQPGETASIVVGLYDPMSGERAELIDNGGNPAGNEWGSGELTFGEPAEPDFACAMNPRSC